MQQHIISVSPARLVSLGMLPWVTASEQNSLTQCCSQQKKQGPELMLLPWKQHLGRARFAAAPAEATLAKEPDTCHRNHHSSRTDAFPHLFQSMHNSMCTSDLLWPWKSLGSCISRMITTLMLKSSAKSKIRQALSVFLQKRKQGSYKPRLGPGNLV